MECLFSPGILEPGSGGWSGAKKEEGEGTRDRPANAKTLRYLETTVRVNMKI